VEGRELTTTEMEGDLRRRLFSSVSPVVVWASGADSGYFHPVYVFDA